MSEGTTAGTEPRRVGVWRKHYALPVAHGAWSWWLGPLIVGAAAGGRPTWDLLWLLLATLGGFLILQPATIAVKAWAGRRPRTDLKPALIWVAAYAALALLAVLALVLRGYERFLYLAAPGVPFFLFYLWLVSRKAERRQMLVELLGAGVLALSAPAAYWVGGGSDYPEPWILWLLLWAQSASAIGHVYLRLEQRRWPAVPPAANRLRAGRLTLLLHTGGLALSILFASLGQAPPLAPLPYLVLLVDAMHGVWRPMVGARPVQIGLRQLATSVVFIAMMVTAYVI